MGEQIHLSKELSKRDKLLILGAIAVIVIFVLGTFTGKNWQNSKNEISSIERLEWYFSIYQDYWGKNKSEWRQSVNLPNIPGDLMNENNTINDAIIMYNSYKPVSGLMVNILLEDICRR